MKQNNLEIFKLKLIFKNIDIVLLNLCNSIYLFTITYLYKE